jgi:thymidine phosphorylase
MVAALGGPTDLVKNPGKHLPAAPICRPVPAKDGGSVAAIATRELGLAVIELGGGRRVASDRIDHAVGLTQLVGKGAAVERGQPLALVHARDEASYQRAATMVVQAYRLGEAGRTGPVIIERIGPDDA